MSLILRFRSDHCLVLSGLQSRTVSLGCRYNWCDPGVWSSVLKHLVLLLTCTGLHNSLHPCIRDVRKWRKNEEMKRKWRENEDMERKWRGNAEMERDSLSTFPHFLSTAKHMYQTCQCPQVEWFSLMWQDLEEPWVNVVWAGGGCFYAACVVSQWYIPYQTTFRFSPLYSSITFWTEFLDKAFPWEEKKIFLENGDELILRNSNLWNGGVFWAVWNYFQRVEQPAGVLNREKEIVETFWILAFMKGI